MAREKDNKGDKGGRIRVLVFELEGSNETLQESLRTVANALGKTISANRPLILPPDSRKMGALNEPDAAFEDEVGENLDSHDIDVTPKPKREQKRKPPRTPEVVEIDLKAGSISFEDFANEKQPSSDVDKYLVILLWLKGNLGITEATTDHAYTCYRHMKWKVPTDPGQPFRNAKQASYVRSGSAKGIYSLTHIGETEVERMSVS